MVLILVLGVIAKRGSPEVPMIGEWGMRLGSRGVAKGLKKMISLILSLESESSPQILKEL